MATNTFPLKYRRKSSPPPSPRMLSPIAHISPSFPTNFISPPPKWLDSDDELEHEPALTSDDAFTVFSSSCSRAPSLAPSDTEDAHVDIVSSPVQEAFVRTSAPPRAPLSRYNKSYPPNTMSSTTREDVAAALLTLHAQPRLGSFRPPLVELSLQTENVDPPHTRRSRVVSPSIRNLVLPRTPSPPPRRRLEVTPVIDSGIVHGTTLPAQRTPPRRGTPAFSPLPASSPFAEEDEYETPEISRFHSVPCPKPKRAPLQVHIASDDSELHEHTRVQSHDEEVEDCDRTELCEVLPAASFEASLVPESAPDERHRQPCASPLPFSIIEVCSTPLSPRSLDHKTMLPTPFEPTGEQQPHGCRPDSPVSAAPPELAPGLPVLFMASPLPDVVDHDTRTKPLTYSRAASSPLTILDDRTTPPSPVYSGHPASSPLSSPPSSPALEQQQRRKSEHAQLPGAGVKRPASAPPEDVDPDPDATVANIDEPPASVSTSTSAPPARARARAKRRRSDVDADDRPWRNRKKHLPTPTQEFSASAPTSTFTRLPVPTSAPPASPSTTTTPSFFSSSPTPDDPNPILHEADEKDDGNGDDHSKVSGDECGSGADDTEYDPQRPCPQPALLGILLETLALSRASSLPLTALTRTTPALASYPHAALTSTVAWAVHARILGCVRSSGEALPPSYFYDPAADPDRERGELLRCLMPRAGKRRETMKYKQYYWAPVVVGRGRTRRWDVDWEE